MEYSGGDESRDYRGRYATFQAEREKRDFVNILSSLVLGTRSGGGRTQSPMEEERSGRDTGRGDRQPHLGVHGGRGLDLMISGPVNSKGHCFYHCHCAFGSRLLGFKSHFTIDHGWMLGINLTS